MIALSEAIAVVLLTARARAISVAETVPLDEAMGRVLARDVVADRDHPPFDRAAMDGYAVRSADVALPPARLRVLGEVAAGGERGHGVGAGEAVRIATGAPVPAGADAVVRVEDTAEDGGVVAVRSAVAAGKNLTPRGSEVRAGVRVLDAGRTIGAADMGVLAAVGLGRVEVVRRPRVALLATGDELVPAGAPAGEDRIRDANTPTLAAALREAGAEVVMLGIARDDPVEIASRVKMGWGADVLVVTGGASVGRRDHAGRVLREAGVEVMFDRVAVRPGKPVLFGTRGTTIVFGLPGNPVSAFAQFLTMVRPAVRVLAGDQDPGPAFVPARLAGGAIAAKDRDLLRPVAVRLMGSPATLVCEAVAWEGSGDLFGPARGHGLALVRAGDEAKPGDPVGVLLYRPIA